MQRERSHVHPHHLSRSATGRWSFVQRVSVDLQAVFDCRLIKLRWTGEKRRSIPRRRDPQRNNWRRQPS